MARIKKRKKGNKKPGHQKRWGYIYTLPFFVTFFIFSFIPIINTIRYSFYEYYSVGLMEVGPNFVGIDNYISLLDTDFIKYAENTLIMWVAAFLPQLAVSLLLAAWLTDARLILWGRDFFKVIIYMPGMIMASAWSVLFFTLFSNSGAINHMLVSMGVINEPIEFFASVAGTRFLICLLLFLMNFGNTTLLVMTAVAGLSVESIESAFLDGCSYITAFWHVVLPSLRSVLGYIVITSMIGGLQMFDIPQIITNGNGNPERSAMTLIMYLNRHLTSDNYGMAGALSVYLFIFSGVLCFIVYKLLDADELYETGHGEKTKKKWGRRRV